MKYKVGDIIKWELSHGYVIDEIIEISGNSYTTKVIKNSRSPETGHVNTFGIITTDSSPIVTLVKNGNTPLWRLLNGL